MDLGQAREMVDDETRGWKFVSALRRDFHPDLLTEVRADSREEALQRGVETTRLIFAVLEAASLPLYQIEAGHGTGHITRDFVNALRLFTKLDADPRAIFVGMVAGTCHDLGCTLVDRYADAKRAVRHTEVAAILLDHIFQTETFGLSSAEQLLIMYGVAAHTHYLRSADVTCADGVVRHIEPYTELDAEGKPFLPVWFPRWVDRLDCGGPAFAGRSYLVHHCEHPEFDGGNFHSAGFAEIMLPLLRTADEIKAAGGKRTLREHLKMFASSQTNDSPYGKHDYGEMVWIRDAHRRLLEAVIVQIDTDPLNCAWLGPQERALKAWTYFLSHNIEPNEPGKKAAEFLAQAFRTLDEPVRVAWCNGFREALGGYFAWAAVVLRFLDGLPREWLALPPITDDVRTVIRPDETWLKLIG